jgi:hypothetical protein
MGGMISLALHAYKSTLLKPSIQIVVVTPPAQFATTPGYLGPIPTNLVIPRGTSIAFIHGDPNHVHVEIVEAHILEVLM